MTEKWKEIVTFSSSAKEVRMVQGHTHNFELSLQDIGVPVLDQLVSENSI